MTELILAFTFALSISGGLLWVMLRAPRSALPLDRPNERSLHSNATPRIGGIAIIVAVVAVLAWLAWHPLIMWFAAGLAMISFLDDRSGLPTAVRFTAHVVVAGAFVGLYVAQLPTTLVIALALYVVWMTNLYNFMDGSDGLAGGMAVFGFGTYAVLAWQSGHPTLAGASLAIVGAGAGFLAFNFHPAKVFMGDAGSIPLGFLAAAIGILGWREGIWPLWTPLAAFGPFVADATVTLLKRLLHGERIWRAHRTHYYQRLVQSGWGHRRTAFAEYGLMALSAGVAIHGSRQVASLQATSLIALVLVYIVLAVLVDRIWARHLRTQTRSG